MEKRLDWEGAIGQQIRLYRNLRTHKMSIQLKFPGIGWRVAGYSTNAVLKDVTFKISEASRQRCIRMGERNVHAFAMGTLASEVDASILAPIALSYNPYKHGFFYQKETERPIVKCSCLVVRDNQVFVSPDAIAPTQDHSQQSTLAAQAVISDLWGWGFAAA